eukprot:3933363-Rhodomonas_salina.1
MDMMDMALWQDLNDDDVCASCPVGFFCPWLDDGAHLCPANTSSLSGGAHAASECFCVPGLQGGGGGPCEPCPGNAYCPGGS